MRYRTNHHQKQRSLVSKILSILRIKSINKIFTRVFTGTFRFVFCLVFCLIIIPSCSSQKLPAPVIQLSTTVATKQNLTEITGATYTVEAGDTLFSIAFYSGNDYRELAKINRIEAPYLINIGQTLRLRVYHENASPPANTGATAPSQKQNKIVVDPAQEQAYGVNSSNSHRKNQNLAPDASNKPDNKIVWGWPAKGRSTIATVGSDGSKRGLDIKGNRGAQVVAAADGKVVYAGNALKGYGNLVIIKHSDSYLSAYAHNQSILVSEQTLVKRGQLIATMGNSGASDVMLHFEIRRKGKSVDPFGYLPKK